MCGNRQPGRIVNHECSCVSCTCVKERLGQDKEDRPVEKPKEDINKD
jgi:hypothetical protein